MSQGDIIADLIRQPFPTLSRASQNQIVGERPMPDLTKRMKTGQRVFQSSWYSKRDWLCGSKNLLALFCWPCLLFKNRAAKCWVETGYRNMRAFLSDSKRHQLSRSHLEAYKIWKTYSCIETIDVQLSRARQEEISRHNAEVNDNRAIFKSIVECVMFLAKQEMGFRGHDESALSLNRGNYRELLECFAKFDPLLERRLHGKPGEGGSGISGPFTGVSSDIQNDVIHCIDGVIQDTIDSEVKESTFFSVQVDETTDSSTREQLSVILRMDKGCNIVERLLEFVNVSEDRSAPAITSIVLKALGKYEVDVATKLVMQTYDGASVMSGRINGVQALIRESYPFAHFLHCAAHRLNLVLCQSASRIKTVKVFFANVSAFSTFTGSSCRRKEYFSSNNVDVPKPGDTRWFYKARAVTVLKRKYKTLMEILEAIIDSPQTWDDGTLVQASGLVSYLYSFTFCFLVNVFYVVLEQSSILYSVLQRKETDFSYAALKVKGFQLFLSSIRNDAHYKKFFQASEDMIGPPVHPKDRKQDLKRLYYELLDNLHSMMTDRFSNMSDFDFLDLANPHFFGLWKNSVPKDKLVRLIGKYGSLFDTTVLEQQLYFVYNDMDFYKDSPINVLEYIGQVGMVDSLSEFVKLLKLNCVISVSSASVERSFSCLKRVKSYLRSSMGQERVGALCRISIHRNILKEKEESGLLHDLVLSKFVKKPRRLNLLYK